VIVPQRDAVLRSDTVVEQARRRIEDRSADALSYAGSRPARGDTREDSIALLHVIPLYQSGDGVDLADQRVADRMKDVRGYGAAYQGNLRWTLEGLYNQDGDNRRNWALLARDSALEFGEVAILYPSRWHSESNVRTLDIWHLDRDVHQCVEQARGLADAGWFTTPFVLSLRLLNIQGALLMNSQNFTVSNNRRFPSTHLIIEPEVVVDWDASLDSALRRIFNTAWQGFGYQRCLLYNEDGTRKDHSAS
jgi:hypothetical protein